MTVCSFTIRLGKGQTSCPQHLKQCRPILLDCIIFLYMCSKILLASNVNMAKEGKKKRKKKKPRRFLIIITFRLISERPIFDLMSHCVKPLCDGGKLTFYMLWTFSCVIWGGFLCCTRVKWWIRKHHICFVCNEHICSQTYLIFWHSSVCTTLTRNRLLLHINLAFFSLMGRSLVEDDDAQMMKVSLGCSEMGLSSHLQASKTGNTRFFTSNTHSSVVLQVSVCDYMSLTKRRGGYVGRHHLSLWRHVTHESLCVWKRLWRSSLLLLAV